MKILHILSTPKAERTPSLVLDRLSKKMVEQEIFDLHYSPPDLTNQLRESSAEDGESNLLSFGESKFLRMVQTTAKVCRERNPNVVIYCVEGFSHFISLVCCVAGMRQIMAHAGNPSDQGWKASLKCSFVVAPLALFGTRMICSSDYVRRSIESALFLLPRMYRLWNCTEGEKLATRAQKARKARAPRDFKSDPMAETLEDHKDHFTLLKTMSLLKGKLSQFRLRIAGDGSLREKISNKIYALELENTVEMLGSRPGLPELMDGSDRFLFATTLQEDHGSVLREAVTAETSITASNVRACREILQDRERGSMVAPKDLTAIADKIVELTAQPPSTETLKENRQFSCQFTPARMLQSYLNRFAVP